MEEQINNLNEQMKAILEKLSNLETNSVSKNDLTAEIKSLKNEISSLKNDMISKNDIKIEVQTITGKVIVLYVYGQNL